MRARRFYPRKACHIGQVVWAISYYLENGRRKIVPMEIVDIDDWAFMSQIKPRSKLKDYMVYYWCKPLDPKYMYKVPNGHALALGDEIYLTKREAKMELLNSF